MKNIFRKKSGLAKTVRVNPPKSNVNLPFSQAGINSNNAPGNWEDKKTRIGKQPDKPFGSSDENVGFVCLKCQYPLRAEPSKASPCPNCGFAGSDEIHETVSDSKRTILLQDLSFKEEEKLSEFRFKMISESSGSEFTIESEEHEIILNRDHLDPGNTSISSKEHLLVRFVDGRIFVKDLSTNGSTFIQVIKKMPLEPGIRIVLGNRIFLFSSGQREKGQSDNKATRQLSSVSFDAGGEDEYTLYNEGNGKHIPLIKGLNILNRDKLDPGNASISGKKHAEMEFNNGIWYIQDFSSNAATFAQCSREQPLTNKVRLIIGNIIFRFEYE